MLAMREKKNRRIIDKADQFTTLFGPKTRFVGTIHSGDNCVVYGQVEGDCHCDGVVMLGERGRWHGNIHAARVVVAGSVTGDLNVGEQLELGAAARITGNITSPVLAMAEGAVHVGGIQMQQQTDVIHFRERRSAAQPVGAADSADAGGPDGD
jgi:cytoskeletal protein CcmA (bactofilin family)